MRLNICLGLVLLTAILTSGCKTQNGNAQSMENHEHTNALINESSPYLLQHAHNPVNWYPWGDEALEKAKTENKLIIISIGYAACHWCHVMEHESFEDTAVAKLMNEHFISIKVDREERPDIDDVYMTACHLSGGGSCGWPLNAIALPDSRPFFAGTYYPKESWMKILDEVKNLYEKNPQRLEQFASTLTNGIHQNSIIQLEEEQKEFTKDGLDNIFKTFISTIDFKKGGRKGEGSGGRQNKFPMPNNYQFLLRYHQLTANPDALKAVKVTLDNMAHGGIYDQLGGGFARYSTDEDWLVPHFEKMLYDNGQLVSLYSEAYQVTKDPLYRKIVAETIQFIERELTSDEGGFYSSLDADSEGVEGKFYVWDKAEIDSLLGENAALFHEVYSVRKNGNWEHVNILHISKPLENIARQFEISVPELQQQIEECKKILMKARDGRVRPGLDDKILTSWNAIMLKGYVDAYRAFGEKTYLNAALANAIFLKKNSIKEDYRLNRNYKDGKSVINAFLDDYALLIDAYISLYQATFDETWLQAAYGLANHVLEYFFDERSQMFFYTSEKDKALIARKMELSDNVIPASNSIMARNLLMLGHYFYKEDYIKRASTMLNNLVDPIMGTGQPSFYSNWCILYAEMVRELHEVAIIGPEYSSFRASWDKHYQPFALLLGGKEEGSLELLKGKLVPDQTTIYVCKNKVCKLPVKEVEKALGLLQ